MTAELNARPRFEIESPLAADEIVERLKAQLKEDATSIQGLIFDRHIELVPHRESVRFWSPQLTIELADENSGTRLRGRFGPHPHVWTLYIALHAIGAFGTLGALMYGISQYIAGEAPWALWALPSAPVLAALVWALAFAGQNLGREQCYRLRRFLEDTLESEGSSPS